MKKFCYNKHCFSQNYSTSTDKLAKQNIDSADNGILHSNQDRSTQNMSEQEGSALDNNTSTRTPDTTLRATQKANKDYSSSTEQGEDTYAELNKPLSMRARCMLKCALQHRQMVREITKQQSQKEE